ncbi:hypothetical protein N665_1527s0005 [Sinapis alba]|nr:hypothetical protein N665_1527s0005 [Sinapis alba]
MGKTSFTGDLEHDELREVIRFHNRESSSIERNIQQVMDFLLSIVHYAPTEGFVELNLHRVLKQLAYTFSARHTWSSCDLLKP